MMTSRNWLKRTALMLCLGWATIASSGCFPLAGPLGFKLIGGFAKVGWDSMMFWERGPFVPVPATWSQQIEDRYHWEERYAKVPILDPVEGENAPLFCMDPPSDDEVIRALPDDVTGGVAFLAETHRNNIRIVVEPIVDRVDECRFYPMVGPARLHHCHYKCTVYYTKMIRSYWPVPFSHTDEVQEVVYVDHDHLIRCAGPASY